jgi:SHS2 domain-containing protein
MEWWASMFTYFEHTADVGLLVEAPDLNSLFVDAARGLFALIVEETTEVRPETEIAVELEGTEFDYLLFDWLNELLFRFETEHLLLVDFEVNMRADGLTAVARGEFLDAERHQLAHEVKAITYHQLEVKQTPEGWQARVIVDI